MKSIEQQPLLLSLTCLNDTSFLQVGDPIQPRHSCRGLPGSLPSDACYIHLVKEPRQTSTSNGTTVFLCAPSRSIYIAIAQLVGLGGLEPPTSPLSGVRSNHLSYRPAVVQRWWSQSGSNRRPQACKASALPTELWPQRPMQTRVYPRPTGLRRPCVLMLSECRSLVRTPVTGCL